MKISRSIRFILGILIVSCILVIVRLENLGWVNQDKSRTENGLPVYIEVTKNTQAYVLKDGEMVKTDRVNKNDTFRPHQISGRYFEVDSGDSTLYIEQSDSKVVLQNITPNEMNDSLLAPFILYYYAKQNEKNTPYFNHSYELSNAVSRADEAITGAWTMPAPPHQLTVNDVGTFDWVKQIPASTSNSFPFQVHGFYLLDTLTNAYIQNSNQDYLHYGRDMIRSWDSKFPVADRESVYKWAFDQHGTALRTISFVNYWNESRFLMKTEDAGFHSQLMRMLYEHAELLADEEFYKAKHNHGIFQDMGLLMIAESFPELERAAEWKRIANERFTTQVNHGVSATGLHLEHSPTYQLFLYQTLIGMIDWAEANEYELDPESKRRARSMPEHMAFMIKPNSTFVQFGDTSADVLTPDSFPYIQNYPELLYSVTNGEQGDMPKANIVHQDEQYVFFRQHWGEEAPFNQSINFGMTAGFHGMPHKHFDDLSIDLYGFGADYIVETGRYGYARALERYSVFKGDAHNSIQIEGEDFPITADKIGMSNITEAKRLSNGQYYTSGQHQLMTGTTHIRSVWYDTRQSFIVRDKLTSNKKNPFLQRFHLAPDFAIVKQTNDEVVATHTDGRTLHMIQLPTSISGTLEIGTSHVSYADYTWFERKQIITRKVMQAGEYVTLLHLGKTPEDRIRSAEWVKGAEGTVLRYTLMTGRTEQVQVD